MNCMNLRTVWTMGERQGRPLDPPGITNEKIITPMGTFRLMTEVHPFEGILRVSKIMKYDIFTFMIVHTVAEYGYYRIGSLVLYTGTCVPERGVAYTCTSCAVEHTTIRARAVNKC